MTGFNIWHGNSTVIGKPNQLKITITLELHGAHYICMHAPQNKIIIFTKVLNQCVAFVGLDTSRLTSHSFRIGRTTLGLEQGQSTEQLRLMGRWTSDAFRKYLKPAEVHL